MRAERYHTVLEILETELINRTAWGDDGYYRVKMLVENDNGVEEQTWLLLYRQLEVLKQKLAERSTVCS